MTATERSARSAASLEEKLEALYALRAGDERPAQDFRPAYLSLLHKLGEPHLRLPSCIHVAGTNGKGSTIAFMRAMLEAAGYSVHVYTSPHLRRFNERIVLAGCEIDDERLEDYIDKAIAIHDGAPLTFFEITTAIAFLAFSQVKADIVLLETGMGGRLDCTNVIPAPLASVITPVSYDHMEFLGARLSDIAREKAGIIKDGSKCIIGPQDPAVRAVLIQAAKNQNCSTYPHDINWSAGHDDTKLHLTHNGMTQSFPRPILHGDHQCANAAAAIIALKTLDHFDIPASAIEKGLRNAHWPARLERVKSGKLYSHLPDGWELWYDGGHNEAAAKVLATQAATWAEQDNKPLHLILGMKHTKDPQRFMAPLLPYISSLSSASLPIDNENNDHEPVLKTLRLATGHAVHHYNTPAAFLRHTGTKHESRILVTGSLYFMGMDNMF